MHTVMLSGAIAGLLLTGCGAAQEIERANDQAYIESVEILEVACQVDVSSYNVPFLTAVQSRQTRDVFLYDPELVRESVKFIRSLQASYTKAVAADDVWLGYQTGIDNSEQFLRNALTIQTKYLSALPEEDGLGERLKNLWNGNFDSTYESDVETFAEAAEEVSSLCYDVRSAKLDLLEKFGSAE